MESFGGLLVLGIIIAAIVYFSKKKEQKEEERKKQEQAIADERTEREIESLKIKLEEKKEEFLNYGLPVLDIKTLKLTTNEVCHFTGEACFCKLKQQIVGYEGGSRGVSFRVMKGVSFRVGNYQGHYVKEKVAEKTNGLIYLTSRRIIFSAAIHSCVIRYEDILILNVIDDMLQIQTEKTTYLFQVEDYFNFLSILEYITNKDKA